MCPGFCGVGLLLVMPFNPRGEACPGDTRLRFVSAPSASRSTPTAAASVITRRARQLGVGDQSLRKWVRQAEIDGHRRRGTTTVDVERIRALETHPICRLACSISAWT